MQEQTVKQQEEELFKQSKELNFKYTGEMVDKDIDFHSHVFHVFLKENQSIVVVDIPSRKLLTINPRSVKRHGVIEGRLRTPYGLSEPL